MNEREWMELAVAEAKKSRDEDDGRVHPRVGVVVVKGGEVLATAHRGEEKPGEHAEYTALERKLRDHELAGSTIYDTGTLHNTKRSQGSVCESLGRAKC